MTSSLIRGRPRRAASHIAVRVTHTLLGGLAGLAWLVLPGMTLDEGTAAAEPRAGAVQETGAVREAAAQDDDSPTADLVLPLLAVGAAGVLGGYAYIRRTRRPHPHTTTPTGTLVAPWTPSPDDLDQQARALLVTADDSVRTSREELAFVGAQLGKTTAAPFAAAVQDAEAELAAAFRMRRQYDEGIPSEPAARRHALAGIVGRCEEAGRRLDAQAPAFDEARALDEEGIAEALEAAETRFRALAGRTGAVETLFTTLHQRYAPTATAPVTGYTEQAKDRLVFATLHLNQARQSTDLAAPARAASHLRAAEAAVTQAEIFLNGIERLAKDLAAADALIPATLTGAEAELTKTQTRPAHADAALAAVREARTTGPYDPLAALHNIVQAVTPPTADPTAGVLGAAADLVARSTTSATDDFIATHRGAVATTARTRLAEADRLLPENPAAAATYAQEARDLAEQDVRTHGNPAAEHESGFAGAVLGGILLTDAIPATYGGPRTRGRRAPRTP
ncbi:hypothetical protein [Streptomyces sp. NPDC046909]|uniref:hypothetical protein n=1 Tax=Streptomyces sp. NPDC046909 TaxID=3155617 RepID=UPI0033EC0009